MAAKDEAPKLELSPTATGSGVSCVDMGDVTQHTLKSKGFLRQNAWTKEWLFKGRRLEQGDVAVVVFPDRTEARRSIQIPEGGEPFVIARIYGCPARVMLHDVKDARIDDESPKLSRWLVLEGGLTESNPVFFREGPDGTRVSTIYLTGNRQWRGDVQGRSFDGVVPFPGREDLEALKQDMDLRSVEVGWKVREIGGPL